MDSIQQFIADDNDFLIVKGAAGTGKTSLMKAVANYLDTQATSFQLLAPTGRAAQNIASKTGYAASTIHSAIYKVETDIERAVTRFVFQPNLIEGKQIFIVDESSMLSDRVSIQDSYETTNALLFDLFRFVNPKANSNKIIFVGDDCQLAPIGYGNNEQSPALSVDYICNKFSLKGSMIELSRVMRQAEGSSILNEAYQIREHILSPSKGLFHQNLGSYVGKADQVAKLYLQKYDAKRHDAVAIISFGNKYISECNNLVRAGLGLHGVICEGDRIVLNQTYYGKSENYISNGEVGEIITIGKKHKVAELNFMDVEIEFNSHSNTKYRIVSKIMLDTLVDSAAFTHEKRRALFATAFQNNHVFRESKKIQDDEYLSAMQIGYGHAFTCHKAQGSEWDTVLLNSWNINNDYRFLYTGVTRARKILFTNGGHLIRKQPSLFV